ncbi:uncharacterized protein LOC144479006 [Augochlora pura]
MEQAAPRLHRPGCLSAPSARNSTLTVAVLHSSQCRRSLKVDQPCVPVASRWMSLEGEARPSPWTCSNRVTDDGIPEGGAGRVDGGIPMAFSTSTFPFRPRDGFPPSPRQCSNQVTYHVPCEGNPTSDDGVMVPRMPLFHQLYTVHIRYNDTGIGIIFVLCECRTKTMYNAIWRKIVSLVPRLQDNLETVMCDYKRAAIESVQAQFPRVTIHGCWFHFTQALLRKWKKLGLQAAPREILSVAMTMPLAPSDMFPEALHQIQLVVDRLCGTFPNVLLFMAYLRNVWLPISSKVSVYGSAVRTNNIAESFHSAIIRKFRIVQIFGFS